MKFLIFQIMIFVPFALGMMLRKRCVTAPDFSKRLIRINLMTAEPLIILWSIWGLSLTRDFILLPIIGMVLVLLGMLAGRFIVPLLGFAPRSRASFLISSSIANQGYPMGGFLCYLMMGEEGLGISFIFTAYFMFCVFFLLFPYAQKVSSQSTYSLKFMKEFFINRQNMPIYAIIAALALHVLDIRRPDVYFPIDILLLVSIGIGYLSLGINFQIAGMRSAYRAHVSLAAIKFLIVPLAAFIIVETMHLDGYLKAVILLESFMPAAVYSVVTSVLFDLDAELASSLFVCNTLIFLFLVLPAVFVMKTPLLGL
ncbi:MAG TPA: AEC family transporter [Deltaproteobacteria bacterium]|nr:AEC family transporter [Deltaproteobacteria bacterium]